MEGNYTPEDGIAQVENNTAKREIKRVSIGHKAREIAQGGEVSPTGKEDPFKKTGLTQEEALTIWKDNKPERLAVAAVLIDHVISKALETFPSDSSNPEEIKSQFPRTFPLIDKSRDDVSSFGNLKYELEGRISEVLQQELERLDTLPQGPKQPSLLHRLQRVRSLLKTHSQTQSPEQIAMNENSATSDHILPAHQRFKDIMKFVQNNLRNTSIHSSEYSAIRAGIHTATNTMNSLLAAVPAVYQRERPDTSPLPNELTEIASNSFPIVSDMAADHINIFTKKEDLLKNTPFSITSEAPKYVSIDWDVPRLQLDPQALKEAEEKNTVASDDIASEIETGCPALVRFGGESSAIRKLWDYNVGLAELVYKQNYPVSTR